MAKLCYNTKYISKMNAKDLQQQYIENLTPKSERPREIVNYTPSQSYINHVKSQAAILTRLLGEEQGNHYIEDAFRYLEKPNGLG